MNLIYLKSYIKQALDEEQNVSKETRESLTLLCKALSEVVELLEEQERENLNIQMELNSIKAFIRSRVS